MMKQYASSFTPKTFQGNSNRMPNINFNEGLATDEQQTYKNGVHGQEARISWEPLLYVSVPNLLEPGVHISISTAQVSLIHVFGQ
jgi:hypothetical protein